MRNELNKAFPLFLKWSTINFFFMNKKIIVSIFLTGFIFFATQAQNLLKSPNIVIFYMDDMGYGDMTITGATGYRTPNLDRLAHDGALFTQYYSPAPVCSASRAGLLTGCYPVRVGITGVLFPNSITGLNPTEEIIPELLKKKKYTSCIIGKWHLGDDAKFMPTQQGFDQYYGLPYSNDMWPYGNAKRGDKTPSVTQTDPPLWLYEGNKKVQEIKTADDMDMLTTQYTQRAVSFIKQNSKNPFFLYIAHTMPHIPLAVSTKFQGKSEQGEYGDVMMEIDWSVGEIVKELKAIGATNNTLIIFTSDNGPWISYGDHAGASGAFREGKFTVFEGGQRVPCIMKWPDVIPKGLICNRLASSVDILPTLVEITKASLPVNKIDGVSLLPILKGDLLSEPRKLFLYNELKAIRDNRFKLVMPQKYTSNIGSLPNDGGKNAKTFKAETDFALYDLRRDAGERYNVIEKYPAVFERLEKAMNQYKSELGENGYGLRAVGQIIK